MKRIFALLSPFKKQILFLLLAVLGYTASNLALPFYWAKIINQAIPMGDISAIYRSGFIMLAFLSFGMLCQILQGYLAAVTTVGFAKNLRSLVFAQIQAFSQADMDGFTTSSLITRTNSDITQVQHFISIYLRIVLLAPIMFLGGIIMTLGKSYRLSFPLLISMPILITFILGMAKITAPLSRRMQQKLDQVNRVIREKLKGIRVSRSFNAEKQEEERFLAANHEVMADSIRLNTLSSLSMPFLMLVLYLTMLAILFFSGFQILQGSPVPIGDSIAIIQYVTQIMMAVMMLSMLFVMYPRAASSAQRLDEVLSKVPSIQDKTNPLPFPFKRPLTLRFENVSFGFPGALDLALENISFEAKAGQITAIIGSTGCGKSTLLDLVPRFYDASQGKITLNHIDIKEIGLSQLRREIGYVSQTAFLFQDSIAGNIDFMDQNLSPEKLQIILKIAQAADFVAEKEEGLMTQISQTGLNLSGGQKQRLAIARAIAKNPLIYLFDDSFSALDAKTDASLRKALEEITQNAIVLIVAQRVSTILEADQIIVLENGKIAGIGKHPDLFKHCKVYQEIVLSQKQTGEVPYENV